MTLELMKYAPTKLTIALMTIMNRIDSKQDDGSLTLLLQKNSREMFLHPSLEKTLSMKLDGVVQILDYFVSKEFMTKTQLETLKFCPICFSSGVTPVERCRYCGTPSMLRGWVIEHNCGYKDLESYFRSNGDLRCPRCGKSLLEKQDYSRGSLMYKCQSCGNLYETPFVDYHCQKCGEYFPTAELGETLRYKYQVVNEKLIKAKKVFKTIELLQVYLGEKGYIVKQAKPANGVFGETYDTNLYLTTPNGEDSIIVETFMFEKIIGIDNILKLQHLKSDLNIKKVLIISNTKLDEKAEALISNYNMILFNPEKISILTKEKIAQLLNESGIAQITIS